MMFWTILSASLTVLVTIQARDEDYDVKNCYLTCHKDPWQSWSRCDSACGGQHTRIRKICCEPAWSLGTCLSECHTSLVDLIQKENCRKECVFGVNVDGNCDCDQHGFGDCCQYSNLTCSDNPCQNNATCEDKDGRYKCFCRKGWTGLHCDVVLTTTTTTTTTDAPTHSKAFNAINVVAGVGVVILIVIAFCIWWCVKTGCKAAVQQAATQGANSGNQPGMEERNVHHLVIVERVR